MSKVLVFTLSYPYEIGHEKSFIEAEIEALSRRYDRVLIYPSLVSEVKYLVPKNCEVNDSFAKSNPSKGMLTLVKSAFSGMLYTVFWKELKLNLKRVDSLRKLILISSSARRIVRTQKFFKTVLEETTSFNLIYSFWFTLDSYALSSVAKNNGIPIISRAHGVDLFEERNLLNVFFRKTYFGNFNQIVCVSNAGSSYLKGLYPDYEERVSCSYLGSPFLDFKNSINSNWRGLSFVSCSRVIPLKRVHLIYQFLRMLCLELDLHVSWVHIGDGVVMNSLKELVNSDSPEKLEINFTGHLDYSEVIDVYKEKSFDFFIHSSLTEGLPLVMMEALSCGIPVISTDCGGVSEIVIDDKTGYLLDLHPEYIQFRNIIERYLTFNSDQKRKLRESAFNFWKLNLNAPINSNKMLEKYLDYELY